VGSFGAGSRTATTAGTAGTASTASTVGAGNRPAHPRKEVQPVSNANAVTPGNELNGTSSPGYQSVRDLKLPDHGAR
jgi:hypothetical protein